METYEHPFDENIVSYEGTMSGVLMRPGQWVRHKFRDNSLGILVANGDDFVTVLWSVQSTSIVSYISLSPTLEDDFEAYHTHHVSK